MLVHFALVFVLKCLFAKGFFSSRNLIEKLFHVPTQVFIPWKFKDWDEEGISG